MLFKTGLKRENCIFLFCLAKKLFLGLHLVCWKCYRIKFPIFTFREMPEKVIFLTVELCLSVFVWVYMCVFMCVCVHCVHVEARGWQWVFLSSFPFCLYLLTLAHIPSFLHQCCRSKFKSLSCPLGYCLSLPIPIWNSWTVVRGVIISQMDS